MYLAHVLLKRSCSVFKSDNPLGVINLMKKTNFVQSNAMPKASKTVLKLSTLSLSMLCLTMTHAAENESTTEDKPAKVVKVAVTGSSIKGVAAQSASPITIVKVDDILKQSENSKENTETPEIDFSGKDKLSPKQKLIILNELGVIDFLNNKLQHKNNATHLAEILNTVLELKTSTLTGYINLLIREDKTQRNSPYNSEKTVSETMQIYNKFKLKNE